ncbi:kua-ubiquitin conjugating enzyme hybrid localization domain protein [Leptospira perolatii]|uniref:Kua-ubiquitin conjugating enzyme hybrid localization domain protein n=1 Tax=Leptospira perolatii TaxID=2023191 RepID=A0A2M9ZSC4_9LEPT|nr:fatty acid desaturase CarF family protein [Leptospira perolatii]PJZ71289.1 kua-ubiquitin conjugating enzyme hybrid localization domain protein [Leptospira perolatii]PJZ74823.1 kua-ubiquitin conjugating enzyme hybrid localization domain protein [Leptospira perolatii]
MRLLRTLFPSPIKIHRVIEVFSVFAFLLLIGYLCFKFSLVLASAILEDTLSASLIIFGLILSAYITADFFSGFVHFLGDSFGNEHTPYVGPAFIFPFRDHHVDPKGITRHDFYETNGNNCLVSLPILLYALFASYDESEIPWGRIFWVFVLAAIFFTNQIHKWAHQDSPSKWIAFLQKRRVILSPSHHQIHHTKPHDSYFCITTGWCNPVLEKLGFFKGIKKAVDSILAKF